MLQDIHKEWESLKRRIQQGGNDEKIDRDEIITQYPLLTAVMVEYSTAYFNPLTAARAILDALYGRPNGCEWYLDQQYLLRRRYIKTSLGEITRMNLRRAVRRAETEMQRPFYQNQLDQAIAWVRREADRIRASTEPVPAAVAA